MNMMTARGAAPPEAPLAMPAQRFDQGRLRAHPAAPGLAARRAGVLGGTAGLTGFAGWEMAGALGSDGWQAPDLLALPVFLVLFARLALSACSFVAGMLHRPSPDLPAGPLRSRTALLFPMHNEETARVFGTADAMREALLARGIAAHFDIFLLSDSTDPARQAREAEAARHLSRLHAGGVFYRRRTANAGRKAGNIADWVQRHGGAYEHFVILDADSVMGAATLHRLAAAMEADARAGLIQTLPTLVGGTTVFARMQQWAARTHGPAIARGLAAWHGEAGNYWGHNAIIRTRAFAEAAGLPTLPGRKPFGGEIMSHDFVEAALLRRAGWGVHIRPDLGGSHESGPQTLGDAVKRDRRWCQGNLQHAALLGAAGLHKLSRLHLLDGILAYAASPLWLLLLGCAALQAAMGLAQAGLGLLALTMALLLLPKLPGLREPGSALREFGLTTLLAPLGMVTQTRQILDILRGRDSGWAAQGREAEMPSWREALREHAPHMMVGALLLLPVLAAPQALPWLIPVSLPLLGAPGLARLVARDSFGAPFRTPEEAHPSPLLCRAAMLRRAWQLELQEAPALRLPAARRPHPAVAAEQERIAA
ncbi:glucans biosynthesis glucosyltransferase MdoH [Sabulicella glaciei]|uniref:Glucans biosynthesis glucosyltransferase H n=1 Tax=Sabulicella glaciei TaxID=2984948 RepID=A0ABT3P3M0_9PROT|nr:glucans biosynthesis glucosyltransferase MdoH [Roseococcus sp. MDT2-1-1]MCW8088374.1 glucans biosynthesis glucosyltransferase MdoH [Roseococcus sp. MDT2-1-1]